MIGAAAMRAASTDIVRQVQQGCKVKNTNASGQSAGYCQTDSGDQAVVWESQDAEAETLPTQTAWGTFNFALGMTATGVVVAEFESDSQNNYLVHWEKSDSGWSGEASAPFDDSMIAISMNDAGEVASYKWEMVNGTSDWHFGVYYYWGGFQPLGAAIPDKDVSSYSLGDLLVGEDANGEPILANMVDYASSTTGEWKTVTLTNVPGSTNWQ